MKAWQFNLSVAIWGMIALIAFAIYSGNQKAVELHRSVEVQAQLDAMK
jgi:hypothetical protein